ncbi:hypothetical protein DPMN_152671 [Dreissena polymorpha]|uniref:Uncharacterized protein n=1 Tax=Dreissena polymorpha TaxID=45954 RepID=A0A9D4J855_DREPO|nr:hypothetical protein DPMN_152671 [Dreissena polymorpha]
MRWYDKKTSAVLSSSTEYLPDGYLSDLSHSMGNVIHVRRSIISLIQDPQVGRVGLYQQSVVQNPSHGCLLHLSEARGQTSDAKVAPREC